MQHDLENHQLSLSGSQAAEKIKLLAEEARYCLFGTDLTHAPVAVRPMTVQSVDEAGNLWFLSGRHTHTNQHIAISPEVQLFFANPGKQEFLTVDGQATIADDRSTKEAHWTPFAKTWFNGGVDDPDLTVIKVEPRDGYYWDTKHGKTVALAKSAVGAVIGKTTDDSIEGKVRL